MRRTFGRLASKKVLEKGLAEPKPVLQQLLKGAGITNTDTLILKMDEEAKAILGTGKQAKALRAIVQTMCNIKTCV